MGREGVPKISTLILSYFGQDCIWNIRSVLQVHVSMEVEFGFWNLKVLH